MRKQLKEKKIGEKITDLVKSIDIFGDSVGFTVNNGSSTYQTWTGTFVSIVIQILVIIYAVKKFTIMTNYEDTNFQSILEKHAIPVDKNFTSEDINFNIAFALFQYDQKGVSIVTEKDMYGYLEFFFG